MRQPATNTAVTLTLTYHVARFYASRAEAKIGQTHPERNCADTLASVPTLCGSLSPLLKLLIHRPVS